MPLALTRKAPQVAAPPRDFAALIADDPTAQVVRGLAAELGWSPAAVHVGGLDALDLLFQGRRGGRDGRVVVLDLAESPDPAGLVQLVGARLGGQGRIVAVGEANDIELYRRLTAAGASDYLVKPVTPEALREALRMAGQTTDDGAKDKPALGRVAVVVGVRGGVGASTIAVNTAWMMAHELKLKTALLDLDLQFGTAALSLDLEPGRGLREALAAPDRLDGFLLAGAMVAESEKLCVLGAEEPVEDSVAFDPNAAGTLLSELRSGFDVTVIDIPRHLVPLQRRLIAGADTVTLVADLSLAGIRDTVRVSQAIAAIGGTYKTLIVAGRVGRDQKPQVDQATFERSVKTGLAAIVPEDGKVVAMAANQGKAIGACAQGAQIAATLKSLAERMAGAPAPPKPGLLDRFLRRPA